MDNDRLLNIAIAAMCVAIVICTPFALSAYASNVSNRRSDLCRKRLDYHYYSTNLDSCVNFRDCKPPIVLEPLDAGVPDAAPGVRAR